MKKIINPKEHTYNYVYEHKGYLITPEGGGSTRSFYKVFTPEGKLFNEERPYDLGGYCFGVTFNDETYNLYNLKICKALIESHIQESGGSK